MAASISKELEKLKKPKAAPPPQEDNKEFLKAKIQMVKARSVDQKEWEDDLKPHQRDRTKESKIRLWIWNCLEEVSELDYEQWLKDGVIICKLMNFIRPGSVPGEIVPGEDAKTKRVNIVHFVRAAQAYGVPRDLLFEPEDLLFYKHIPKFTRCLYKLGELAGEDPNFKGPKLGAEPPDRIDANTARKRGGMPIGDDIYVSHVDIKKTIGELTASAEEGVKKTHLF